MAVKVLPVLMESGVLKLADGELITVGSKSWTTWLSKDQSFRYEGKIANVTVRPGKGGWYAYKKIHGRLYNAFVAPKTEVSVEKLETVAADFIRRAEENKLDPTLKQTEIDELRSLLSSLQSQLEAVKEELKQLSAIVGKSNDFES
ncbi:hypothetical protein [Fischerella sp. PCC 9605]|uniref:hypothetical protein n=1 Tax=Fischerella sp. PCC 9605 TaxID=1173024 RepID=UPI00047EC167|nr:hypothetical protein [Fischerella sp. PCC 9605]